MVLDLVATMLPQIEPSSISVQHFFSVSATGYFQYPLGNFVAGNLLHATKLPSGWWALVCLRGVALIRVPLVNCFSFSYTSRYVYLLACCFRLLVMGILVYIGIVMFEFEI